MLTFVELTSIIDKKKKEAGGQNDNESWFPKSKCRFVRLQLILLNLSVSARHLRFSKVP